MSGEYFFTIEMDLVLICVIISYNVNVGNGRQRKPNPGCYCAVAASAPTSHLMGFSPQRKSEVTYAEFLIVSTFFLYTVYACILCCIG